MKFLSFFLWRDIIEIGLLTVAVYYLSLWLKKDRQKNLLFYLYGYCTTIAAAHILQLNTISHLLLLFSPLTVLLFVCIHQETLQKNFVALCNITPARITPAQWLEHLMQTVVTTMNNRTPITCIIERSSALDDLVHTQLPMRADITKELLNVVISSSLFDATTMLWLNTQGTLLGINATFKTIPDELMNTDVALFFTTKTDALLLKTHAEQRTLTIIVNGKEYSGLTTRAALHLLKKYIGSYAPERQGVSHEYEHTQNRTQQPHA